MAASARELVHRRFPAAARRRLGGGTAERIAAGVWRVRGGIPRAMNVYLTEHGGGGVTVFDAGIAVMARAIAAAAARLGGIDRVVLGHGHPDHRGAAGAV
jgi:glyoxylase-like metal-dependent hydrolase (beta-lactamase superfamily II)